MTPPTPARPMLAALGLIVSLVIPPPLQMQPARMRCHGGNYPPVWAVGHAYARTLQRRLPLVRPVRSRMRVCRQQPFKAATLRT